MKKQVLKSRSSSPILEVFEYIFPDIRFVENFLPGEEHSCSGAGFDELKKLRLSGNMQPVLILGFDSLAMMPSEHLDILAPENHKAVFYLQLPCSRIQLEQTVQEVRQAPNALPLTRKEIIREIRAFKHTCDNLCMSRSGITKRVEKMLPDSRDEALELLREFGSRRLNKLTRDYKNLSSTVVSLALPDADRIEGLFADIQSMVAQIEEKDIEPEQAVNLSFSCIQKLKRVSEILDAAKVNE